MKQLLILTYANFPNGEAASVRISALTKIIDKFGYDINIISMSRIEPFVWNEYEGVNYCSVRYKQNDLFHRLLNVLFYKKRAKQVIKKMGKIDAIMPMSLQLNTMLFCERYAKKNGIKLITDRTEWYSSGEFKGGIFSWQYLQNHLTNAYIIDKYWKVISISCFFEDYYKSKGISTVRIPAIMDLSSIPINEYKPNNIRRVVYAGSPANKDSLWMIIKAFGCLPDDIKDKIELHVYGVEKNYCDKFKNLEPSNNIYFHGRVSRDVVLDALRGADFSTLFRDGDQRFAKAGFPSKIAESMSVGLPPITNLTSDLELYLKDGVNAAIVEEYSIDSYVECIKKVASYSDEQMQLMHINSRRTAETVFDYSNYVDALNEFLA